MSIVFNNLDESYDSILACRYLRSRVAEQPGTTKVGWLCVLWGIHGDMMVIVCTYASS